MCPHLYRLTRLIARRILTELIQHPRHGQIARRDAEHLAVVELLDDGVGQAMSPDAGYVIVALGADGAGASETAGLYLTPGTVRWCSINRHAARVSHEQKTGVSGARPEPAHQPLYRRSSIR